MKKPLLITLIAIFMSCDSGDRNLREAFVNPDNKYRPMPFWHINGEFTTEGIEKQVTEAKQLSGFGGVTVLPVNPHAQWPTGLPCPGTAPQYLSNEYFARYGDILKTSEKIGTEVILYDDIDFPSGSAGGRLQKEYPQYTQKQLVKYDTIFKGPKKIKLPCPDSGELLMAVSAMNMSTLEVVDIKNHIAKSELTWDVPAGDWRVMFFTCKYNTGIAVDYMQPEAAATVIKMTYDEYAKRFSKYFGNVINKTFYDDVGFVHQEEVWTPAITQIFEDKYKKNPALFYPALFYNIGPETQAARVAFFDIRSELMAEGYVRQVAEWSAKYNLRSMGHPPESYSPNTSVANGDILKYYRHSQIPLTDAIFYHGRGIHGFKQISSAADLGDKPLVGAEIYGAFPLSTDSIVLYCAAMEMMARGINFLVPHGMWYDTHKDKIRIPPLISHENELLTQCLPNYSTWAARSCMMLQGGTRVSDIALLWPITAIHAESYINRDENSGLPVANWLPQNVNHHVLSNMLSNELRRDFTFVHPEDLHNGKIVADGKELKLNNVENLQRYKVLIMPGGEVISAQTLKAIKQYYDNGGKVIAAELLPSKSAEFGRDDEVKNIVSEIFGNDHNGDIYKTNTAGGIVAFVKTCDTENMASVFEKMDLQADVIFNNVQKAEKGYLNYIHKQNNGKEIWFVSNSTLHNVDAEIKLRGVVKPELWDPHTGEIVKVKDIKTTGEKGQKYTTFKLSLPKVYSLFIVASK